MGGVTKVGRTLVNKQEGGTKGREKDSKKKKCLLFQNYTQGQPRSRSRKEHFFLLLFGHQAQTIIFLMCCELLWANLRF